MNSLPSLTDDDETFFQGIAKLDDTFFLRGIQYVDEDEEEESNFMEGLENSNKKIAKGKENVKIRVRNSAKPKQITSPIPQESLSQSAVENTNENPQKTTKTATKTKRVPLKTLNINEDSSTKAKNVKPKSPKIVNKKKSPSKEKEPSKRKSTAIGAKKETTQRKSIKKENDSNIVIYKDSPDNSLLSIDLRKSRPSFPEKTQSTVIILPRNRKFRYSLDARLGESLEVDKKPKTESISPIKIGFDVAKAKPLSKPTPTPEEIERSVQKLETMFPNVDPEYLKAQYVKLKWSLQDTIEILLPKEDSGELPSRADYLKRKETEKLHNKYWENFTIENYLKLIPDPWQYFLQAEKHNCYKYASHSFYFLKNKFKKHYSQVLQEAFTRNDYSLYLTCQELSKKNRMLKMRATNRSKADCDAGKPTTFEIQFLHEMALVEYESQIKAYIKKEEGLKLKRYQMAEKNGELSQCLMCKDYLLPPEDVVNCSANHIFCVDCVVRFVKVEIREEDFQYKCLKTCKEKFSKFLLHEKLGPLLMATTIKRMQLEKCKPHGIENLVSCSFCYYIMVVPQEIVMVQCLNPLCMLKFCRFCKQPSQTHSKCTESEKHELDKTEKKPIDPFLKCLYCNKEFIHENDAVKITCSCGAVFCSICQRPFPECEHLIDKDFEACFDLDEGNTNANKREKATKNHMHHYDYNEYEFDTPKKEPLSYTHETDFINDNINECDYNEFDFDSPEKRRVKTNSRHYDSDKESDGNSSTHYDYNDFEFDTPKKDTEKPDSTNREDDKESVCTSINDYNDFEFDTPKSEAPKYLSSDEDFVEATDSLCF